MARTKLTLPEKVLHSMQIPVRITDINYGNHLGNDALVSVIHEARMQFLQARHYTELNAGGTSLIMGDLAVEYKGESFYGDVLHITLLLGEISSAGFELYYDIKNQVGKVIAYAKTGMVCFDYDKRRITPIPQALKDTLLD